MFEQLKEQQRSARTLILSDTVFASSQATLAVEMVRTVHATRYVTPLREGGSLPAIVEGDDLGLYVLKFRGAGQGPLALAAELIAGEIGRALQLRVPEIVFVEVDEALGRNEPDEEIRDLLNRSQGLNLALDYLPGSVTFDPAAGDHPQADVASRIVWFDAFITNVDRTPRNTNLLCWHKNLYLIDHGAALYFHHNWLSAEQMVSSRFAPIRQHVLLPWATKIQEADAELRPKLTPDVLTRVVEMTPTEWIEPAGVKDYLDFLARRLASSASFVEEAQRAQAEVAPA